MIIEDLIEFKDLIEDIIVNLIDDGSGAVSNLLLESGDDVLLEDGISFILLE